MALTKATQNVLEGIVSTGSTGVSAGSFQVGQQYKITSLGTTTQSQWNTIAGTTGQTYVVGSLFTAATIGASSGTGAAAVARTLANRFADVVNVRDFGDVDGIGDVTLSVPSQYPTIQDAFTYLATKRINSGTTVKIQVADGTHVYPQAVYINHPDGSNIEILGNQTTPANCVLSFSNSDGFYLAQGFCLKKLNGFRIVNTTTQTNATARLGIITDAGSFLKVGPAIEVHNFYYGISARNSGFIDAAGSPTQYVKVTASGDVGIWAFLNSHVNCEWAKVSGSDDSANSLGGGIIAEFSSSILATGCEVSYNWLCGFSSLTNSTIRAFDANSHHNRRGLVVDSGGNIEYFGSLSQIKNNTEYGIYSETGTGFVYGIPPVPRIELNTLGNFYNIFDFNSGKGTAINSGSLLIDATQPANITASDAYVDLNTDASHFGIIRGLVNLVEKGRIQHSGFDGSWRIISNNSNAFFAYAPPSSVNYVQAEGSIAGQSVNVKAYGNDPLIDLALFPKGNGSYIKLGAGHFAATGSPATTGYIQVKDSSGVVRKLAVIA